MEDITISAFLLSFLIFITALAKPSLFKKILLKLDRKSKKPSKKSVLNIFGFLTLIAFISLFFVIKPKTITIPQIETPAEENIKMEASENVVMEKAETSTPSPTASIPQIQTFLVTRIVDGDTIEIEGGKIVRYIGIDTPETEHPTKGIECYGKEASKRNKQLVLGKKVELEKDISETDKYGRLLRYLWLNGTLINEQLVAEGYALSSSYPPDTKHQNRFLEAQKLARSEKRGLWDSFCDNWKEADTPVNSNTPIPDSSSTSSCLFSCSEPDKDCGDFATQIQAQTFFDCCGFTANYDPMKLDSLGVGDGIPCESLP